MEMTLFTDCKIIKDLKETEAGTPVQEDENRRLKQLYVDAQVRADLLREAPVENGEASAAMRAGS